jgi:Fe-S cluster biosynthesis and repair protein YggX
MKRLTYLAIGMIVGGLLVTASLKYHVLRTSEGFTMVPKTSNTFQDAYVDVRQFGVADWASHQSLTLAIIQAKKESILHASARDNVERQLGEWVSGAGR